MPSAKSSIGKMFAAAVNTQAGGYSRALSGRVRLVAGPAVLLSFSGRANRTALAFGRMRASTSLALLASGGIETLLAPFPARRGFTFALRTRGGLVS